MEGSIISTFRTHVLSGEFENAIALVPEIESHESKISEIKTTIYIHKYLEQIEKGETMEALNTLKTQIIPTSRTGNSLCHIYNLIFFRKQ